MIITAYNTKGGVGKSTVLQQLILPAVAKIYNSNIVYIDTDKMNKSSKHIANSKFVKEIIAQQITNKDDIAKLITTITEKLGNNNTIILLDPPAADSASNVLEVILAFSDLAFVFIPTLNDESDIANTERVKNLLQKYNVRHEIVYNKQQTDDSKIYLDSLSAVIDFANRKQKTIVELADEINITDLTEKAFINLIKRVYANKITRQFDRIHELLQQQ